MNNHVVDLETAKKLKDYLPVGWESGLIWVWHDNDGRYVLEYKDVSGWAGIVSDNNNHFFYPAPTLSEMLELIPKEIDDKEHHLELCLLANDANMAIGYKRMKDRFFSNFNVNIDCKVPMFNANANNLATAAALLYMWLVDEGHIGEK